MTNSHLNLNIFYVILWQLNFFVWLNWYWCWSFLYTFKDIQRGSKGRSNLTGWKVIISIQVYYMKSHLCFIRFLRCSKKYSHWLNIQHIGVIRVARNIHTGVHSGSILKYSTHRFHNICSSELPGIFTLEALCSATRTGTVKAKALDLAGPAKYWALDIALNIWKEFIREFPTCNHGCERIDSTATLSDGHTFDKIPQDLQQFLVHPDHCLSTLE